MKNPSQFRELHDRHAKAMEAVNSMLRALFSAGFTKREAQAMLQDVIASLENEGQHEQPDLQPTDDDDELLPTDPMSVVWRKLRATSEREMLRRLQKRLSTIDDVEDDEESFQKLRQIVDLALANLAVMQAAARTYATEEGLQVESELHSWRERATDKELDEEERILFLDSRTVQGSYRWESVATVANKLAQEGRISELEDLCERIKLHGVILEKRVRNQVSEAAASGRRFRLVKQLVLQLSEGGGIGQSDLIRRVSAEIDLGKSAWMLERWLSALARAGLLSRTKKSGKWWLETRV